MFIPPWLANEINIPAAIPPDVSTANDLPGLKSFIDEASETSLIKVKPEMKQNGTRTMRVNMMLARYEGVSPGLRKSLESIINKKTDITGPEKNNRLMLRILVMDVFGAIAEPAADAISHDPRNVPAISS